MYSCSEARPTPRSRPLKQAAAGADTAVVLVPLFDEAPLQCLLADDLTSRGTFAILLWQHSTCCAAMGVG